MNRRIAEKLALGFIIATGAAIVVVMGMLYWWDEAKPYFMHLLNKPETKVITFPAVAEASEPEPAKGFVQTMVSALPIIGKWDQEYPSPLLNGSRGPQDPTLSGTAPSGPSMLLQVTRPLPQQFKVGDTVRWVAGGGAVRQGVVQAAHLDPGTNEWTYDVLRIDGPDWPNLEEYRMGLVVPGITSPYQDRVEGLSIKWLNPDGTPGIGIVERSEFDAIASGWTYHVRLADGTLFRTDPTTRIILTDVVNWCACALAPEDTTVPTPKPTPAPPNPTPIPDPTATPEPEPTEEPTPEPTEAPTGAGVTNAEAILRVDQYAQGVNGRSGLNLGEDQDQRAFILWHNDENYLQLGVKNGSIKENAALLVKDRRVGVGTATPTERLHINGNVMADDFLEFEAHTAASEQSIEAKGTQTVPRPFSTSLIWMMAGSLGLLLVTPGLVLGYHKIRRDE
jgi:hypothetical protein